MAERNITTDLRDGGEIHIPEVPSGCVVRGINPALFPESVRLAVFHTDLVKARTYLQCAKDLTREEDADQREALFVAAMLRFMGCFESTAGARQKPLSAKRIFDADHRARLKDLRLVRNRMVAHDEQLYGGVHLIAAIDEQGIARQVYSLNMTLRLHTLEGWEDNLAGLVEVAYQWTSERVAEEHEKIIARLNSLPEADRAAARAADPFQINVRVIDGLWRKDK